jgi:hypothetical protein
MTEPTEKTGDAIPASPTVTFAKTEGRTKQVKLTWPVIVDGVELDTVTVRRMTGADVQKFMDDVAGGKDVKVPPMFDIPASVYDLLDDDDRLAVDEAAMDFLPRRLRMVLDQTPASGANTSAS